MNKTQKAICIFSFVGGLILIGIIMVLASNTPRDDRLCVKNALPSSHTVILVDSTDSPNEAHKRFTDSIIKDQITRLKKDDQISIYALAPEETSVLRQIISLCHPGRAVDYNPLTTNTQLAEERYQNEYLKSLNDAIKILSGICCYDTTPLLEGFYKIANEEAFDQKIVKRSLIVISDMLEHSSILNQYTTDYDFDLLRDSGIYVLNAHGMKGVEVIVNYLKRNNTTRFQNENHKLFWEKYFLFEGINKDHYRLEVIK